MATANYVELWPFRRALIEWSVCRREIAEIEGTTPRRASGHWRIVFSYGGLVGIENPRGRTRKATRFGPGGVMEPGLPGSGLDRVLSAVADLLACYNQFVVLRQ